VTVYGNPHTYVPVVPGDLHDFRGDVRLSDAYVISQDVSAIQLEARARGYLTDAETPRVDVLDGGLSWTGVMDALQKHPQSHAKGRNDDPRVPMRYVVLVFVGLLLTGLGLVGWWLAPLILEAMSR